MDTMKCCTQGSRNGRSKLVENEIKEIRQAYMNGVKQAELCKKWDMCRSSISQIVRNISWKHVQ